MEFMGSAKSPDFAVLNKQFQNCFIHYSVGDRMHRTSKPIAIGFEEQVFNYMEMNKK